ncbi:MAG: VOC family protein [Pyrinomonadaceae bacterium]|nr:VOC family protein [Pyrinomonadaceae bacterium]
MKTHVSLNVNDLGSSIDFYKQMFGVDPMKVRQGYAKFDVAEPPLNLALNETKFDRGGSLSHLGLQVETTQEVLSIGKRWQENGLITLDEMQTNCCFALQDKTWVTDPDGNAWEVFTVLGDTEPEENLETACCVTAPQVVSIGSNSK